jgi:hypothetical protein
MAKKTKRSKHKAGSSSKLTGTGRGGKASGGGGGKIGSPAGASLSPFAAGVSLDPSFGVGANNTNYLNSKDSQTGVTTPADPANADTTTLTPSKSGPGIARDSHGRFAKA